MKARPIIIKLVVSVMFCMVTIYTRAQTELVEFIQGGIHDGEKLIQAYLEPLGKGLGANLNGGWYNTAKVHKSLGFDITITVVSALPPQSSKTFDLTGIGLRNLKLKHPEQSMAPTISGSRFRGPRLVMEDPDSGLSLLEFQSVAGLSLPLIPLPMIKAGVGLPLGLEVNGRFIPKYTYKDMSIYMYGGGLKIDVLQFKADEKRSSFLNASVMGAYTFVNTSSAVDFQTGNYAFTTEDILVVGGQPRYDNQKIDILMHGFMGMALVSYDLPLLSPFAGIGYSHSITNVDLLGEYPVVSGLQTDSEGQFIVIDDIRNPISLSFDNFSGLQYVIGLRAKIAIVSVHVDYTRANYNLFTVGAGVTLR